MLLSEAQQDVQNVRIWDRKSEGGFPGKRHVASPRRIANLPLSPKEVKQLKQLVRNIIDPDRDLGHADKSCKEKPELGTENERSVKMHVPGTDDEGRAKRGEAAYEMDKRA